MYALPSLLYGDKAEQNMQYVSSDPFGSYIPFSLTIYLLAIMLAPLSRGIHSLIDPPSPRPNEVLKQVYRLLISIYAIRSRTTRGIFFLSAVRLSSRLSDQYALC